jgi:multiple sugar transport system substrate-binding protein
LFDQENLSMDNPEFRHVWETCYAPSVTGGFAIYSGYSSDLAKTGDIICSTGSSAGVLFYGNTITYSDNTTEQVDYTILPFPTFANGNKIAIQRGNGLMVAKSDKKRETAAAIILKWFTSPSQNIRFIAETGYLPVTDEAFETLTQQVLQTFENKNVRQLLQTVTNMYTEYDFFVAPTFESFDDISKRYEQLYKSILTQERQTYLKDTKTDFVDALNIFIERLNQS